MLLQCSVLTSCKHDLTACKLVKNGLTGGIYTTRELGTSRDFPNFDLHL